MGGHLGCVGVSLRILAEFFLAAGAAEINGAPGMFQMACCGSGGNAHAADRIERGFRFRRRFLSGCFAFFKAKHCLALFAHST